MSRRRIRKRFRGETKPQKGERPAPARNRRDTRQPGWIPFAAVVLLAVTARILFLLRQTDAGEPFSLLFWGDTSAYLGMATSLFGKVPFDQGIPFHPPGVSYFLGAVLWLAGYGPGNPALPALTLKLTMALVGGLTVGLFYLLVQRLFGRTIALASLPLAIFSFGHYLMSSALNAEVLFLCLVMSVLLGWSVLAPQLSESTRTGGTARHLISSAGLGVLAGLASLVRAEFLLTTLLTGSLILILRGRRAMLPVLAFVLFCGLTILPWTMRSHEGLAAVNRANADRLPRPLPEWVVVSAAGALNFATANNEHASGAFDTRMIDRLVPNRRGQQLDVADPEVNRLFVDGYRVGLTWMIDHPAQAVRLLMRKVRLAADAMELGYLQGNLPVGVSGDRRPVDLFTSRSGWLPLLQLALALLGAWRLLRSKPLPGIDRRAWMLLLPHAITTAVVIVAFFGFVRFGMLLIPLLWILVGAGCLALLERLPWSPRWRQRPERGVCILLLFLLAVEIVGALSGPLTLDATGTQLPGGRQLNPDELVHISTR